MCLEEVIFSLSKELLISVKSLKSLSSKYGADYKWFSRTKDTMWESKMFFSFSYMGY